YRGAGEVAGEDLAVAGAAAGQLGGARFAQPDAVAEAAPDEAQVAARALDGEGRALDGGPAERAPRREAQLLARQRAPGAVEADGARVAAGAALDDGEPGQAPARGQNRVELGERQVGAPAGVGRAAAQVARDRAQVRAAL